MKTRKTLGNTLVNFFILLLLIGFAALILMPLLWMVLTGFKTNRELFLDPWTMPETFHFKNYSAAWKSGIGYYFINSVIVTVFATTLTTCVGCLAAYPLARVNFKGKRLSSMQFSEADGGPAICGHLPLHPDQALGLYDQRLGLILVESTFNISFLHFPHHGLL
jgi:raffinose/stachyose/melibiose transport system permease protein